MVLRLFFIASWLLFVGIKPHEEVVSAIQHTPQYMNAEEGGIVNIVIEKGDVGGFAKLQQVLPPGFSAEVIDAQGATFSSKKSYVKFIWVELPLASEFTVKYRVTAQKGTAGEFLIAGVFSYLFNNERADVDIEASSMHVINEPVDAFLAKNKGKAAKSKVTVREELTCKREIVAVTDSTFRITLTIEKDSLPGGAKLIERIPEGFSAKEDVSTDGKFSFKSQQVEISWKQIPEENLFSVSYMLRPDSTTKNGEYTILGSSFSYLFNNRTKRYSIKPSTFKLSLKRADVGSKRFRLPISNYLLAPEEEHEVVYKIQVGASHTTVKEDYFTKRFNLRDYVNLQEEQGWIKYTVGNYNNYKEARDKRNLIRNNVQRAFITAYNKGKRITVQEALIVSNQHWYK